MREVSCVGVGTIGSSWATLFAWKGCEVKIYDVSKDILNKALERIRTTIGLLNEIFGGREAVEDIFSRVIVVESLKIAVKDSAYVQESAIESYSVKKELFKKMDEFSKSNTILATSTSGLKISEIQKAAKRCPERCITVHPYNPPHMIPLVEVVPGENTSKETIERTVEFMKEIGKKPIVVRKDVPGMVANRWAAALWREAVNLVHNGIATPEEIDIAVKYGPGIRWALTGVFLTYHLGGGTKGMKYFLDFFKRHFEELWKDLGNWTEYPPNSFESILQRMEEYRLIKEKSYDELTALRDKKLAEMLKTVDDEL